MPQPERVLDSLGQTLRSVRRARGFSQEQLSLETGIHRNYIGGIERGERNPSVASIVQLSTALGISLSELFSMVEQRAESLSP